MRYADVPRGYPHDASHSCLGKPAAMGADSEKSQP